MSRAHLNPTPLEPSTRLEKLLCKLGWHHAPNGSRCWQCGQVNMR
jgi:hypothetical protein